MEGQFAIPGDVLGEYPQYDCGIGCKVLNNNTIVATLTGEIIFDHTPTTAVPAGQSTLRDRINIISSKSLHSHDTVIDIGDVILARVIKLTLNQVIVDILSVGDRILRLPSRGIIRKEDIRLHDIDSLIIHECYRPGDIVRGVIISLGDARQYYISTADMEYGVRWCKSEKTGNILIPLNSKEMEDPETKIKELRKVAKPN